MKTWNVNAQTTIRTDRMFHIEAETEAEAKKKAREEAKEIAASDYYNAEDVRVDDVTVELLEDEDE